LAARDDRPTDNHVAMRRSRRAATLLAIVGLAGVASPALAQPAPKLSTYPVPGLTTATPGTQLSFRGAPPEALGTIVVVGTRSGRHSGRLRAHSDGLGASWLPNRPFTAGELVRVRTRLHLQGARDGDYSFTVARRPPPRPPGRAEPASVGYGTVQRYATRLDLVPPALTITTRRPGRASGLIFLGVKSGRGHDGPMIIDDSGRLVWFKPIRNGELANDFRVQTYRGRPVLTWWQGRPLGGHGRGEGVLYDERYKPIRRVRAAGGFHADHHDFELTPHGTALLLIYDPVRRDLSSVGGSRDGVVTQAVVQEIDVETGLVIFEWHSLGNIALSESYKPVSRGRDPYDYMHINSVALDAANDIVISARAPRAVYRISRATGRVVWRLGGRRSDFTFGPGARFALQHDARPQPDGTLTIYDNSAHPPVRKHSRAITLALDPASKVATLRQALVHPRGLLAATQGGVQRLPNAGTFVGWGSRRWFSEYDAAGQLVLDGHLARGNDTYRAYRFPWTGRPDTRPKALASRNGRRVTVRVSWNGATQVAQWQLLAGRSPSRLTPIASVPHTAFEATLRAQTAHPVIVVRALDASGAELGRSRA
jgi:hypothetical protein